MHHKNQMPHKLKNMRIMPHQAKNLVWALVAELEQKASQLGEYAMLITVLVAQIIRQTAQIAQQLTQITSKDSQIQALTDELASLKARMSKDSHNSSKPPSTDGLQKKTKSLRKPSGKPSGGQKGHKGSTLAWTQTPTRTVILPLPEKCDRCDKQLAQESAQLAEKRQVINLPPIQPEVTEYQTHTLTCQHCGCLHTSLFPSGVTERIQYGPGLKAIGVLLTQWHNLPYLRTSQLISSLFNVHVLQGTLLTAEAIQVLTCNYERLLAIGEKLNPRKTERTNNRGRIKQTDAINLLARLRDHAKAVLHFLRNPKVPFTNNTGERAVRMPKGKQKVAGCFRSVLGAEYYFTIRSYLDTLYKQGHNVFDALLSVFQGTPMQPASG
jgi:transposase